MHKRISDEIDKIKEGFIKKRITKSCYNIVCLGNTGVGKSSLLNMLGNTKEFIVGEGANAQTKEVDAKYCTFLGQDNEIELCLIDTQGLFDPNGDAEDIKNVRSMVTMIRKFKQIDLFLYCIEANNPRFTTYIQETITLFDSIFPQFLDHTVLIFNKADIRSKSNRSNLTAQWQDKFIHIFGYGDIDKKIPCFFLDSHVPAVEQKTHDSQAYLLRDFIVDKGTSCDVINIEPKKTVRGQLNEDLEKLQQELEDQRKIQEKLEKELVIKTQKAKDLKKTLMIGAGSAGGTLATGIIVAVLLI